MEPLIISVEEAREILGEKAESMTDDQIVKLIQDLDAIASAFIKTYAPQRL